jgi:hypothetical protein
VDAGSIQQAERRVHDKEALNDQGSPPKDGKTFPDLDGCLMILGGPEDDYAKCQHKVYLREVSAAKSSVPKFLCSSSTPITFDRGDHHPNVS